MVAMLISRLIVISLLKRSSRQASIMIGRPARATTARCRPPTSTSGAPSRLSAALSSNRPAPVRARVVSRRPSMKRSRPAGPL